MAFTISSRSIVYHTGTGDVDFSITFSEAPDFETVDAVGRQHHAFQVHVIESGFSASLPAAHDNYDSVIQGSRIAATGDLVVRQPPAFYGDDEGGNSGGWGAFVDLYPFVLVGDTITFSIPLAAIAPSTPGGEFPYCLISTEYGNGAGAGSYGVTGTASVAP